MAKSKKNDAIATVKVMVVAKGGKMLLVATLDGKSVEKKGRKSMGNLRKIELPIAKK
ncbi:MAG: hypothetical protein IJ326_05130 [Lachnospiraceae bacterium]|nr:hypothetical protein [Lachnospiraceae bacterium]